MKYTLGLNFLSNNETVRLDNMLKSTFVDGKCIFDKMVCGRDKPNPEIEAILKKYNVEIVDIGNSLSGEVKDYGKARNIVYNATDTELIMWLDDDDIILNPERVVPICEEAFQHDKVHAIGCEYYFVFDDKGLCTSSVWRERIVRKEKFSWTDEIHETLSSTDKEIPLYTVDDLKIKHCSDIDKMNKSRIRCYELSKKLYEYNKVNNTMRGKVVYEYARGCQGMDKYDESIKYYKEFLEYADDTQKGVVYISICDILIFQKKHEEAKEWSIKSILLNPENPDGYIDLARSLFIEKKYKIAVNLLELSLNYKPFKCFCLNPQKYDITVMEMLSYSYANIAITLRDEVKAISLYHQSIKCGEYVLNKCPSDKRMELWVNECKQAIKQINMIDTIVEISKEIENNNTNDLKHFLKSLPEWCMNHSEMARLKDQYVRPVK